MNKPIDIVQHKDHIAVWDDSIEPMVIDKEELFQWLYDQDMLSWEEHPTHPDMVGYERSGIFTMEQYFDQSPLIVEADVIKYLDATVF